MDFFEKQGIRPEKKTFLLACSGGVDSMVLLHLLYDLGFPFSVAHGNFALRGPASDADERLVREKCAQRQIPFYTERFQTREYARKEGLSIQMAARHLRYTFFKRLMHDHGFDYLLTGHHLNDSFETFLINTGRGSGIEGLLGVPEVNERVLRPMHTLLREEIEAFAKANGVTWREDASNQKTEYQRNKIRLEVLPALMETSKGYQTGFSQTLQYIKQAHDFAEGQAVKTLKEGLLQEEPGMQKLLLRPLTQIKGYPYLLHHWLKQYGRFDERAIHEAIAKPAGQYFDSEEHELLVEPGALFLRRKTHSWPEVCIRQQEKEVRFGPYDFVFERQDIKEGTLPASEELKRAECAFLDADKLVFPLKMRCWEQGDRFVPYGMQGSKLLSDFFNDQKVNRFQRGRIPLLMSGEDIVWICGYRINDNFKLTNRSNSVYFGRLIKPLT